MKKFLLLGILVLLTGCSGSIEENGFSNYSGFKQVLNSANCYGEIWVFEKTDVMYVVDDCYNKGGISVMLEADGKPMLWSNWKSYYESLE